MKSKLSSYSTKDIIKLLTVMSILLFCINWVFSIPAIILSYKEHKKERSGINSLSLKVACVSFILYGILIIYILIQSSLPRGQEIIDPGEDPTYYSSYVVEIPILIFVSNR